MARIIWSPQSLEDLDSLRMLIAKDAPRTAEAFIRRIFDSTERLKRFPLSGALVPELRNEVFREIHVKKYRIIYRVLHESLVEIVTVYHGARLLNLDLFFPD